MSARLGRSALVWVSIFGCAHVSKTSLWSEEVRMLECSSEEQFLFGDLQGGGLWSEIDTHGWIVDRKGRRLAEVYTSRAFGLEMIAPWGDVSKAPVLGVQTTRGEWRTLSGDGKVRKNAPSAIWVLAPYREYDTCSLGVFLEQSLSAEDIARLKNIASSIRFEGK